MTRTKVLIALLAVTMVAACAPTSPQQPTCREGYAEVYIHGSTYCLHGYKP